MRQEIHHLGVILVFMAVIAHGNPSEFRRRLKRQTQSALGQVVQQVLPDMIGQGVNFFSPAPPPLDQFVPVYLPMPDPSRDLPGSISKGPTIIPIVQGNIELTRDQYKFPSSVTLVRDKDCDIMVDTGLNIFKNTIIGGLAAHGLNTYDIKNVVLTHGDVDSAGNLNLFWNSQIYSGNKRIFQDVFYDQQSAPQFRPGSEIPSRQLCQNTDIYLTPGYTVNDLTLVVRNVEDFGTIAIVGNLIMNEQGVTDSTIWRKFSANEDMSQVWEATRRAVICMADYIIPGHGKTFKVTEQMKQISNCNTKHV